MLCIVVFASNIGAVYDLVISLSYGVLCAFLLVYHCLCVCYIYKFVYVSVCSL